MKLNNSTQRTLTVNINSCASLARHERLRRVVLLCCSFARNVAFFRAGKTRQAQHLLSDSHPEAAFWRQANANFLDMAVLEWCKLLGDQAETPQVRIGKHHWRRVVTEPVRFELGLLAHLELDIASLAKDSSGNS